MRRIFTALIVGVLAFSAYSTRGHQARAQRPESRPAKAQDPKDKDKTSVWMKHKLDAAQKILEGLTRGDFDLIEKQSLGMQNAGYLEGWIRADVPGYASHLHAFNHANREMLRAAKGKNLDGVAIAYSQMTISCVQCHRFMRDTINLTKN